MPVFKTGAVPVEPVRHNRSREDRTPIRGFGDRRAPIAPETYKRRQKDLNLHIPSLRMPVFETGAIPFDDGGICFLCFYSQFGKKKEPPDIRQPLP